MLKIPTVIHEQNVFPGMTVKMSAKFSDCVAISFEDMKKYVSSKIVDKCVLTGNPLRENLFDLSYEEARKKLGIGDEIFIMTVGGSLGAVTINNALCEIINSCRGKNVKILGGTGAKHYDETVEKIGKEKLTENIKVLPYIHNMNEVLPAADLVVARAGAVTVSELAALGKPAILIPFPGATNNHQEHNARSVQEHGAAVLICERDLKEGMVASVVEELLQHPEKLREMSECARAMAIVDGTKRICDIVAGLCK